MNEGEIPTPAGGPNAINLGGTGAEPLSSQPPAKLSSHSMIYHVKSKKCLKSQNGKKTMTHENTGEIAEEMFAGEKLYQLRARQALPLLVRQALAQSAIEYGALAKEVGMPNPRNLNFVLGSIGVTLQKLGDRWAAPIPPIQSLVINQSSGMPGDGFYQSFTKLEAPTRQQRKAALQENLGKIFAYPNWLNVLKDLNLHLADDPETVNAVEGARQMMGGGEGEAHRRLKDRIYEQPSLVNAPRAPKSREREFVIPSGDKLDVFFEYESAEYAIEVKASTSPVEDVTRGLFQCVKYEAVLTKWRAWQNRQVDICVILALGGCLPKSLIGLRSALGVTVIENLEIGTAEVP
jgi:hypothetical protein